MIVSPSIASWTCIQPTYEELKHNRAPRTPALLACIQPTYEELKPPKGKTHSSLLSSIQPTYEELKQKYAILPVQFVHWYPAYL